MMLSAIVVVPGGNESRLGKLLKGGCRPGGTVQVKKREKGPEARSPTATWLTTNHQWLQSINYYIFPPYRFTAETPNRLYAPNRRTPERELRYSGAALLHSSAPDQTNSAVPPVAPPDANHIPRISPTPSPFDQESSTIGERGYTAPDRSR